MLGINIGDLNFNNTNIPPANSQQVEIGNVKLPTFFNARSVSWRNPNILFIASYREIYQMNTQEKLQQNEDLAELRAATSIAKQQFSDMNKKIQ